MGSCTPPYTYSCQATVCQYGEQMCTDLHCSQRSATLDKYCHCQGVYEVNKVPCTVNGQPAMCCPFNQYTAYRVESADGSACYCCCSCFAWGTPIAVPEGIKEIQNFLVGDPVMVAGESLSWGPATVEFSDGTGVDTFASEMVQVTFAGREGGEAHLVVTPNHLFFTPGGRLRPAGTLVPGDLLVQFDGTTTPVLRLELGLLKVGVHHIATSTTTAHSMEGHLLNSNGIVTADYALQVSMSDAGTADRLLVEGHQELAWFGTPEYARANPHLQVDGFSARAAGANTTAEETHAPSFEPFGGRAVRIPEHAQRFFSRKQALQLAERAPQFPYSSGAGVEIIRYLFKVYGAFYPGVNFYLDAESLEPNAWSFREYGMSHVVVSGALGRLKDLGLQGMGVVVAHELGHLFGGQPQNGLGYTCEGASDYAGVAAIMRQAWLGTLYGTMARTGVAQVETLFGYLDPGSTHPESTCDGISLRCRSAAMMAGMNGLPLPACAGGEDITYLEVTGADAEEVEGAARVTVRFNVPVNPDTATDPANYLFEPYAEVLSAEASTADPAHVVLTTGIVDGGTYRVRVVNVLSADNEFLFPGFDHATFTYTPGGAS
jgi:hypothetical protein